MTSNRSVAGLPNGVELVLAPCDGDLVRAVDIVTPRPAEGGGVQHPATVFDDGETRVTMVAVASGHAFPALAYRFDTPDGSVVFSGDTTANDDLIDVAQGAANLVHSVADLSYLERHGTTGPEVRLMAGPHTDVSDVGGVAERAHVDELILTHYLPGDPDAISEADWAARAGKNFNCRTVSGRDGLPRVFECGMSSSRERVTHINAGTASRDRAKIRQWQPRHFTLFRRTIVANFVGLALLIIAWIADSSMLLVIGLVIFVDSFAVGLSSLALGRRERRRQAG